MAKAVEMLSGEKKRLPGLRAEPAVEIDGEGIAAFDGIGLIGICSGRRLGGNNRRATEQREKKRMQRLHASPRTDAQKGTS